MLAPVPAPTTWVSRSHIREGVQLVLSVCARVGDVAQASHNTSCSHRAENHVVYRLRPEWQDSPAFKGTDRIAWEWVMPEPAFTLCAGEQVLVLAELWVDFPFPPGYDDECPYNRIPMCCVKSLSRPKVGWCKAWDLEVPLL